MNSDHLKNRVRVMAAGVAVVGLASVGLSACTPAPSSLSCTTLTSVGKNGTGTLTVKTLPGAKVLTVANYGGASSAIHKTVSDSSGVTTMKFDLTRRVPGNKIDIAVSAVKGTKQGLCAAWFKRTTGTTENNNPGGTTPGPLTGTTTVTWLPATDWQKLAYRADYPNDTCYNIRPGTGAGCGSVVVSTLLKGLSSYGGIVACPDGTNNCPRAWLSGQLQLNWQVSCDATGEQRTGSAVVKLGPAWQSSAQYISPDTADGASTDAARLTITADLPLRDDVVACGGDSTLDSINATALTLHLNPNTTKFPSWNFASGATYQHP